MKKLWMTKKAVKKKIKNKLKKGEKRMLWWSKQVNFIIIRYPIND